jgi:hypothetical protein
MSETWAEVSSCPSHLLHKGLSIISIKLQMSSQGVMSSKEADKNPGLCPVAGQQPGLSSRTRARNKFLNLSLSIHNLPQGNNFNVKGFFLLFTVYTLIMVQPGRNM